MVATRALGQVRGSGKGDSVTRLPKLGVSLNLCGGAAARSAVWTANATCERTESAAVILAIDATRTPGTWVQS